MTTPRRRQGRLLRLRPRHRRARRSTAERSRRCRSPRADEPAQPKDPIAILGYPQDGPFDIEPGRIRAKQTLRSPDIYGDGAVIRDVFSMRGLVRPGNSGGPIVDSAGQVAGVVFAASVTDDDTGYALTADAGRATRRRRGQRPATTERSTEGCARLRPGYYPPLRALGISLPCSIAFSGGPTCLSFLTPIQPISAVSRNQNPVTIR